MTAYSYFGIRNARHNLTLGVNEENTLADLLSAPNDGWITQIGAHASATERGTRAQFAIWRGAGNNPVLYRSAYQWWGTNFDWRKASVPDLRIYKNHRYWLGYFVEPDRAGRGVAYVGSSTETFQGKKSNYTNAAPDNFNNFTTLSKGRLSVYAQYVPNSKPNAPRYTDATPAGLVGDYNPLFEFTLPHPASEGGRDHTTSVQVRIYDQTTGQIVYDRVLETTQQERNNGKFSRRLYQHTPGHSYWVNVRHRDSFGVWSDFAGRRDYQTNSGPDKPVLTSPAAGEQIFAQTPAFQGNYSHPDGVASAYVQIQVWNEDSTIKRFDSGWDAMSGDAFVHGWNYFDTSDTLKWGDRPTWRARFKDAGGVVGPWSDFEPFTVNASPYKPSNLSPGGGNRTKDTTLSFSVRDPDGDDINAVHLYIYDVTDDAEIYNRKDITGPWPSGSTVTIDVSVDVQLGHEYRWNVSADDGHIIGPASDDETFIYDDVPQVTLLAPAGPLTNLVAQPSAEYDPTEVGQYWTLKFTDASNTYTRTLSSDTPRGGGRYVWRLDSDGSTRPEMWSPDIPVSGTKYFLTVSAKKLSGTSALRFFANCKDASGNHLANVFPQDPYPVLPDAGADVADVWSRYGGILTLPSGTATIDIIFSNGNSATTMLIDEFYLVELPGDMPADGGYFYGYFDGNTAGYGEEGDYYWSDVPGSSESIGLNILTQSAPEVNVQISYDANAAKASDRLQIERWTGTEYAEVYNAQTSSARTEIPLPGGVIRNEGRYRIQVTATDVNGLSATTGWSEFDVRYAGPAELVITQIADDPVSGSIGVVWEPSNLDPGDFDCIEVAVESSEEGEIFVARITDPAATEYTYHYPVSGRTYTVKVRQVAILDAESVEGPWRGGDVSVSYDGWFIKAVEDPENLVLAFTNYADDSPQKTRKVNKTDFRPHGRKVPTRLVGAERASTGSFTVRIKAGDLAAQDQLDAIDRLFEYAGTVCILSHRPNAKVFASLDDIQEEDIDRPWIAKFILPWTQVYYVEDVYLRDE